MAIVIYITGTVIIKGLSPKQADTVKKELTFDNPEYVTRKKRNQFIPQSCQPKKYLYEPYGPHIRVTRGYINRLLSVIKGTEYEIIDKTVCPKVELEFHGELRDYQEQSLKDALSRRYGVLEAATGAGKTVIGLAYIAARKTSTLIIVHSTELMKQWIERIKQFLKVEHVGQIGSGKFDVRPITVGIINSVYKHADEINDYFGCLIADECHRVAGNSWMFTLNTLKPRYQLGLSATPFRSDGQTKVLYRIMGPMLHQVDRKHLESTGAILVPCVLRIPTDFYYLFKDDYARMITHLTVNMVRNSKIIQCIAKDIKENQGIVMVVSDRVDHCERLMLQMANDYPGIRLVLVHGRQSKELRTHNIEMVKDGRAHGLIATASLLGEGFDAPNLSSVFLCTPMRFAGRVLQTIGRLLRPMEGKAQPRVYDFRDYKIEVLRNSGFGRDRIYKNLGWDSK